MKAVSMMLMAAAVLVAGCRNSTPQPHADATSPISVQWKETARTDAVAHVNLTIEKLIPTERDLGVEFRLVGGARFETDVPPFTIAAAFTGIREVPIAVRSGGDASSEVVAVVDGRGREFGYHAEVPYRFGRPSPTPPAPLRAVEPIRMGGQELGRPVKLE